MPSTSTSSFWSICLGILVGGIFIAPCNAIARELLVTNTHKELVTTVLQNQIDGFSEGKTAVTRECHVRYVDPNIPESIRSRFTFNSICFEVNIDQNKESIYKRYGGAYSNNSKKWVSYYDGDGDRTLLSPVSRIYPIKTANSSGFARTTDEIIGDPNQRVRFFSYCLFHDAEALCGNGQVMKISDPKNNLLPYALEILRSVQFIEPPATGSAASAVPASKAAQ